MTYVSLLFFPPRHLQRTTAILAFYDGSPERNPCKCMKAVPLEEAWRARPIVKTSALLFTSKDLRLPRSSFYCPHFLMVPSGALCGLRKMQLKWLYLLRQRCCNVPATQKHNPKAASAQKWDLALPWHACQNESGGWHAGSQIRVKNCV